ITIGSPRARISASLVSVTRLRWSRGGVDTAFSFAGWRPRGVATGTDVEYDVVDQADRAHLRRHGDEGTAVDRCELIEALGVDDREIFGIDTPQVGCRALPDAGGVALALLDGLAGGFERVVQRQRAGAVGLAEADVAAGEREPVGLADRRHRLDPDRD